MWAIQNFQYKQELHGNYYIDNILIRFGTHTIYWREKKQEEQVNTLIYMCETIAKQVKKIEQ